MLPFVVNLMSRTLVERNHSCRNGQDLRFKPAVAVIAMAGQFHAVVMEDARGLGRSLFESFRGTDAIGLAGAPAPEFSAANPFVTSRRGTPPGSISQ